MASLASDKWLVQTLVAGGRVGPAIACAKLEKQCLYSKNCGSPFRRAYSEHSVHPKGTLRKHDTPLDNLITPRYVKTVPSESRMATASATASGLIETAREEGLTDEQKEFYEQNGYLVLENFATTDECHRLIGRIEELVSQFDPATTSIFSTKNQKQTTNDYFMRSAGNISFFFEEKAFDEEGKLRQPKPLSINKVGHALHDLDPEFRAFSRKERVAAIMASLGYRKPLPIQSMYIFKQPGIGGEVVPHQDSTFLYTDPPSCTGLWVALEDATVENGCLWALPGSHKGGLPQRFFVGDDGKVSFQGEAPKYDMTKFVPLEVKAGSAVLLHGSLVHQSYENSSPKSRHAYSVHVIEGEGCQYLPDNWLQRQKDDVPFEPLLSISTSA